MATFVFFDEFKGNLGLKAINLNTDTFNVALSNTAPSVANDAELSTITQIAAGNGYSTGGQALDTVSWAETGAGTGIWKFTSADEVFTASGGSIATFQYVVLFSDTSVTDKLVGYMDYGAAVNITVGNTFTVDVGANGYFQLDG